MKITFLGTAGWERIPSMYCNCDVCRMAKESGDDRYWRTQTQTLIDDKLLIDFGMDNYIHFYRTKKDFSAVENLLITHNHSDHFLCEELCMRAGGQNLTRDHMQIYGGQDAYDFYQVNNWNKGGCKCTFNVIDAYQTFTVGEYTVTSIPSIHMPGNPMCYIISDGKTTLFYSLDTGILADEVYEFLGKQGFRFDTVIADCTYGLEKATHRTHMTLKANEEHREKLKAVGCMKEETKWYLDHLSHIAFSDGEHAFTYEEFEEIVHQKNMLLSYDGLEIEI